MSDSDHSDRGAEFESVVWEALSLLQSLFPRLVEVKKHPRILLHNAVEVEPDFELTYRLPHQTESRLIECQDRNRSTHDIVRKIRESKNLSNRNRFIFVYPEVSFLTTAVRNHLDSDGIVHHELAEFVAMLSQLARTLERTESITLEQEDPKSQDRGEVGAADLYDLYNAELFLRKGRIEFEYFMREWERIGAVLTCCSIINSDSNTMDESAEDDEVAEKSVSTLAFLHGAPKSVQFMIAIMRFASRRRRLGPKFCREVIGRLDGFAAKKEYSLKRPGFAFAC